MGKEDASFDYRWDILEVNPGYENKHVVINVGVDQTVEIDKLYGPLCALGVRIRLEYNDKCSDWVVEREKPADVNDSGSPMEWVEVARWDCQLDWWKNNG